MKTRIDETKSTEPNAANIDGNPLEHEVVDKRQSSKKIQTLQKLVDDRMERESTIAGANIPLQMSNAATKGFDRSDRKNTHAKTAIDIDDEEKTIKPNLYELKEPLKTHTLKEANELALTKVQEIGGKVPHSDIAGQAKVSGPEDNFDEEIDGKKYSAVPTDELFPFVMELPVEVENDGAINEEPDVISENVPTETNKINRTYEVMYSKSSYGYTVGVKDWKDANDDTNHWKIAKEEGGKFFSEKHIKKKEPKDTDPNDKDNIIPATVKKIGPDATAKEVDAITKVVSEGARFKAVERLAKKGNLKDYSFFYQRNERENKAFGYTFMDLWNAWSADFEKEWAISDEEIIKMIYRSGKKLKKPDSKPLKDIKSSDYELQPDVPEKSSVAYANMVKGILGPAIEVIEPENLDKDYFIQKDNTIPKDTYGQTAYNTANNPIGIIRISPTAHETEGAELATVFHELYLHYYHMGEGTPGHAGKKLESTGNEHTHILTKDYGEQAERVFKELLKDGNKIESGDDSAHSDSDDQLSDDDSVTIKKNETKTIESKRDQISTKKPKSTSNQNAYYGMFSALQVDNGDTEDEDSVSSEDERESKNTKELITTKKNDKPKAPSYKIDPLDFLISVSDDIASHCWQAMNNFKKEESDQNQNYTKASSREELIGLVKSAEESTNKLHALAKDFKAQYAKDEAISNKVIEIDVHKDEITDHLKELTEKKVEKKEKESKFMMEDLFKAEKGGTKKKKKKKKKK